MTYTSQQKRPISNAKDAFQCQKNVLVTNHSKVKVWCDFLLYICSWEANLGQNGLWFTWVSCFYLLNKNDLLLYTTVNSDNIIVPWNDDFKGLDSFFQITVGLITLNSNNYPQDIMINLVMFSQVWLFPGTWHPTSQNVPHIHSSLLLADSHLSPIPQCARVNQASWSR